MNNGQAPSLPFEFKKGLDLPITGEPDLAIEAAADVKTVAVIGTVSSIVVVDGFGCIRLFLPKPHLPHC